AGAWRIPRLSRERAGEFAGVAGRADDRSVEEGHERCDASKDRDQLWIEAWTHREIGWIFAPADELLVAQVISGWMFLHVATRHARQLFSAECTHRVSKGRRRDDPMELPMIISDACPDRVELDGGGHVDAAAHPDPLR